ncbi:hypothetical protein KO317_01980 [Candidatus Micrarchaeota archaeon]|nr:hypothetical protein [Candidatus Micrarchaeota archaeon]
MSFSSLIRDKRVIALFIFTLLAISIAYFGGLKFGIDFSGGTRIPVILERPVSTEVMDQMIETIKTRVSTFGLTEIKVRARGDDEIIVEIPSYDDQTVRQTIEILERQGVFLAVFDGKSALKGSEIYTGSIVQIPAERSGWWSVSVSVSNAASTKFGEVSEGKAGYPIYMFLDRPSDASIFITKEHLVQDTELSTEDAITMLNDALRLEGNSIGLYLIDAFDNYKEDLTPISNTSKAIISKETSNEIKQELRDKGFILIEKEDKDLYPKYSISTTHNTVVKWDAIGLVSVPYLSPSLAGGPASHRGTYAISGPGEGNTVQEMNFNAQLKAREMQSILKGGSLPVGISVGSKTSIPAPLGSKFLEWSAIGGLVALLIISLVVSIRYMDFKLVFPILIVSLAQITILVCIIGYFTIDLGAFAGLIAAVGTSVDEQIVITDELMKKDGSDVRTKLKRAYAIVTRSRAIIIVAMLPLLLFSGLVEIIGFATSTILGAFLGVLLARYSYAAFVEHLILKKKIPSEKK